MDFVFSCAAVLHGAGQFFVASQPDPGEDSPALADSALTDSAEADSAGFESVLSVFPLTELPPVFADDLSVI